MYTDTAVAFNDIVRLDFELWPAICAHGPDRERAFDVIALRAAANS